MTEARRRWGDAFGDWLAQNSPPGWEWDWPYQRLIRQHLDNVTRGKTKRLMLFLPPRHGKTEMVTVRYPVWRLAQDPDLKIIVGAYNQALANKFSRKARRVAPGGGLKLSKERNAVEDWETIQGGNFRAVGVGGGITGQGGDLIIIDDPVKNREEANSPTYRERVFDWYTDDLYTRLEPGAAMLLIMTRWHEDDLAGRILRSEDGPNWTVVSLPAEAEEGDPLGRKVGEALCPARFDVGALRGIHTVLGRSYWALYQQRPQEQEGDTFKRSWFEIVRETPANARRVRYWDNAATAGDGDFTVGTLMAEANGMWYVEDVVRGQWSSGERDRVKRQTAELDAMKYANAVHIWNEQEGGSAGKDAAAAFIRLMAGFPAYNEPATGPKPVRADPFAAQCEAGNVKLKQARWNEAWLDELTSFPQGQHDDQVDSASGAFNKLSRAPALVQAAENPFYR